MAELDQGDTVVEIGAGLGVLTERILLAGADLYSIELDRRLFDYLTATLNTNHSGRFHFTFGDAVDLPLANLPVDRWDNFKIIANLPYAISSVWMDRILAGALPKSMTLLLQKETADRFCAIVGSGRCGSISVRLQGSFEVCSRCSVPPHCFFPAPKVESTVVHLMRRSDPFIFGEKSTKFLRHFFNFRRKQLQKLCRAHTDLPSRSILDRWFQELVAAGLPPQVRSDQIPLEKWKRLDELCRSNIENFDG